MSEPYARCVPRSVPPAACGGIWGCVLCDRAAFGKPASRSLLARPHFCSCSLLSRLPDTSTSTQSLAAIFFRRNSLTRRSKSLNVTLRHIYESFPLEESQQRTKMAYIESVRSDKHVLALEKVAFDLTESRDDPLGHHQRFLLPSRKVPCEPPFRYVP